MKKLFLFLILLPISSFGINFNTQGIIEPSILYQNNQVQINLPKEALDALKKWNSKFLVYDRSDFTSSTLKLLDENKTQPMAFVGDVLGNGISGLVLLGEAGKTQYVVALIKEKNSWKALQIYSSSLPNIKKTHVPTLEGSTETGVPFYILPAIDEHAKRLSPKIGIQVEAYLGFAEVYEIKNGKPKKFTLSEDGSSSDFYDVKK